MITARNPRAEAQEFVPTGYEARVLEPSPPAVHTGEFTDDPTARSEAQLIVSALTNGDLTWTQVVGQNSQLEGWARSGWLGPWDRLADLPADYTTTRETLHQIAYFVLSPARHRANTKIGLRFTRGGFGTPFFGSDQQMRLEGSSLVVQRGEAVEVSTLTTIGAACQAAGIDYRPDWYPRFRDQLPAADPDRELRLAEPAQEAIYALFGFGCLVLEELRARSEPRHQPSYVQIWPEHFDIATELGDPERQARASYGVSPGDDHHPEPYLYVAAWSEIDRRDPLWNDPHFNGASLGYRQLLESEDQVATALEFYLRIREVLSAE
ncbi:MAG TPA: hypothetical protein VJR05_09955 [Acidimicrobiia bacterium]|nr:hypothetical protein [Acidimicrobiia bacterium]